MCGFTPPVRDTVIAVRSDFYTTDNLGNVYTVHGDELLKFTLPSGKMFARYSNLKLGDISSVDATNPLKVLLFYKDFQQLVFLDNQLSVNSDLVSLEKLGFEQTELVCASANNGFWIYNKQNNELIRFDENSRKVTATGNLAQVLQEEIHPVYMMEHNGYLYLNSPARGIYVFDLFGAFMRLIPIAGLKEFQVVETAVFYQKENKFCRYDPRLLDESCSELEKGSESQPKVRFTATARYEGYKDSICIRSLAK